MFSCRKPLPFAAIEWRCKDLDGGVMFLTSSTFTFTDNFLSKNNSSNIALDYSTADLKKLQYNQKQNITAKS